MINDQQLLGVFDQVPGMARPTAPPEPAVPHSQEEANLLYKIPPDKLRQRRWGRSEADEHPWERAADELYRWQRETPEKLAAALMPTGRAPFTTAAPLQDQTEFWVQQLTLPDGTINQVALDALLTAASAAEVHELAAAIRKARLPEEAHP